MNNYYKTFDLKYLERCICKEKFNIHNPGELKFYVPGIMPLVSEGNPKDSRIRVSKTHLLNKNKSAISSSGGTVSNYITAVIPSWLTAGIKDFNIEIDYDGCTAPKDGGKSDPGTITHKINKTYFVDADDNGIAPMNMEFIMAFIGGDFNNRKIIGRYN